MNLFEWEGKELFQKAGIPVPRGGVARSGEEAVAIAGEVGYPVAIKAQVLAGSRGKAGGIKFAGSAGEVKPAAEALLGINLRGYPVSTILVEEKLSIARELYMSILVEPALGLPVLIAGSRGGVDIEVAAQENPGEIKQEAIDLWLGLRAYQARCALKAWGLEETGLAQAIQIAQALYGVFRKYDAELAEINPFVVTREGKLVAADAKLIINDNALYRQNFPNTPERHASQLEHLASRHQLNYVKLEGNIGVICTGAGLTLATIDLIRAHGGSAANFLESGGANYQNAYHGLTVVLSDPEVKVLLINTFGLVSRADVICRGLADGLKSLKPDQPIIASIRGTGEEEARRIFREELGIEPFAGTEEAVKRAVALAGQ